MLGFKLLYNKINTIVKFGYMKSKKYTISNSEALIVVLVIKKYVS